MEKKFLKVVGIAFIDNNELLISMSNKSAKKGKYTLVGGGVDEGETLKEAAARECMEEIGNNFEISEDELTEIITFTEEALSDDNLIIEMHMFLALKKIDVELKPNDEIVNYRWFKLGDDLSMVSTAVKDHFLPYAKRNKLLS